jgi:uncharacterized integral membrane protein
MTSVYVVAGSQVTTVWPSHALQIVAYTAYAIGATALTAVVAVRAQAGWATLRYPQWRTPSWAAQASLFLAFVCGFLFVQLAGFLQFAVGLSSAPGSAACMLARRAC